MRKSLLILFASALLMGCGSTKHLTDVQVVERIKQDTLYINQTQYDSIFVYKNQSSDYHLNPSNPQKQSETDTLFVKDISVEYRYKLLRDTVYKTRVDSIPVIKEVEVTKTEKGACTERSRSIPSIYKWSLGICITLIVLLVLYLLRKLKLLNL